MSNENGNGKINNKDKLDDIDIVELSKKIKNDSEDIYRQQLYRLVYVDITKRMTRKEKMMLDEAIDDVGTFEDLVYTAIRKYVNPELLTSDEIQRVMTKLMSMSAIVDTVTSMNGGKKKSNGVPVGGTPTMEDVEDAVNDVVNNVEKEPENTNPMASMMKDMVAMIQQSMIDSVKQQLMSKMPQLPIGNNQNSSVNGIKGDSEVVDSSNVNVQKKNNKKVFTGDD
jgi:hypothetical protein